MREPAWEMLELANKGTPYYGNLEYCEMNANILNDLAECHKILALLQWAGTKRGNLEHAMGSSDTPKCDAPKCNAPKCNAPEESSDTWGGINAPNYDALEGNSVNPQVRHPKHQALLVRSRIEGEAFEHTTNGLNLGKSKEPKVEGEEQAMDLIAPKNPNAVSNDVGNPAARAPEETALAPGGTPPPS